MLDLTLIFRGGWWEGGGADLLEGEGLQFLHKK